MLRRNDLPGTVPLNQMQKIFAVFFLCFSGHLCRILSILVESRKFILQVYVLVFLNLENLGVKLFS